jgi:Ca2+-binding RTX toxin-like protein
MATYFINGAGNTFLDAFLDAGPRTLKGNIAYVTATEFGIKNGDGSMTYVYGKGFAYDAKTGEFTAGKITSVSHYDSHGIYIDDISGFDTPISVTEFQVTLESSAADLGRLLMSGDDSLNAFDFDGHAEGVTLDGFGGDDNIQGSQFGDTLFGSAGDDKLYGNHGDDTLGGGAGNDVIHGARGDDAIFGDDGVLMAGAGNDRLFGGIGRDSIDGGYGNDMVNGGAGKDSLTGGAAGNDRLTGGVGEDTFTFNYFKEGAGLFSFVWGNDTITDFEVGVDRLVLDLGVKPVDILSYANDKHGNAVITFNSENTITLIGIDAKHTSLDDLLM